MAGENALSTRAGRGRNTMKTLRAGSEDIMLVLAAALVAGALGYLNLHNDEVQEPLLVLLVSSFLLGAIRPRHAWVWAIIIGLGVPLSSLLALRIGVAYPCRPGHPYSCDPMTLSNALSTFLLLVPALVSAYLGVLLRQGELRQEGV